MRSEVKWKPKVALMSKGPAPALDSSLQQHRFLECFAACGSVLKAARSAKLNRQSHYWWLKEDQTYRERFEAAGERAARALEDEAVRRAVEGIRRPVWYKGRVVGYETEYSDSLLMFLLKANAPDKFKDRSVVDMNVRGEVELRARLEAARRRVAGQVVDVTTCQDAALQPALAPAEPQV